MQRLYPLRFEPILKRLIWGGRRLGTVLGKPIGDGDDYAESWEVSDHRDDVSVVADGPLAGTTLRELVRTRVAELLGPALGPREQFPLLVKFIDAHDVLSVQVHPDDERGRRLADDNGKTEAWVVVHADPGSVIYAGLEQGVTRERLAAAIEAGRVEPLLHRFEPNQGDCILIPAGTVHAIGAGVMLAEIQQMSDATFRIFDWGRVGADGKPRKLHISESLESIDFGRGPVGPVTPAVERLPSAIRERLARCPYFAIERLKVAGKTAVGTPERFTLLLALEGSAEVRHEGTSYPLAFGQTRLLPASIGRCEVVPSGAATATIVSCVVPTAEAAP
ncbi:MAG TPA: type I phosphomannose isomerase catalytic subunit [Isosphaeraceae bacterium]|jgi:mannose-6-phosphate isomerase|nr:type I phosphomannose isomerase catalytic subunit [Isosphaeraceae bacterium]